MHLEYEKLSIREAVSLDARKLCEWWNDGEVMAHAGFPHGLNKTSEEVIEQLRNNNERKMVLMLVYDSIRIGEANYGLYDDYGEIGIKICEKDMQNKGLGKKYLSLLLEFLFDHVDRCLITTNEKNTRARHVYSELGFREMETVEGEFIDQDGNPQNVVHLELLKEDFRNQLEQYYLIMANSDHLDSLKEYRQEFIDLNERIDGGSSLEDYDDMEKWLLNVELFKREDTVPPGYAIGFEYYFIDRLHNEIVGLINLRPDMSSSKYLEIYGGNIGYSIKPSRRKEGLASLQLKKFLPICKREYGLDSVIITCLDNNTASRKTILGNGGKYINTVFYPPESTNLERYLIEIV